MVESEQFAFVGKIGSEQIDGFPGFCQWASWGRGWTEWILAIYGHPLRKNGRAE